jgi:hypothetical protein
MFPEGQTPIERGMESIPILYSGSMVKVLDFQYTTFHCHSVSKANTHITKLPLL